MKKIITLGLSLSALLVATSAAAQDGNTATDTGAYANLGVSLFDTDSDLTGVVGRLGYNVSETFGVEGEATIGLNSESEEGIDLSINSQFAGFAVARYPFGKKSSIFGRLGYQTTKIGAKGFGQSVSETFDGFAWGFGGAYMFSGKNGVRVDYTRYSLSQEGETASTDTISATYVRKF